MFAWIIARLKEPSTWRGLTMLAGLVGFTLSPEQWQAISTAVLALLGAVEVFRPEVKP